MDVVEPSDGKKKYEKLENYQHKNKELERMWKVKAKVVSVVVGPLGAEASKLGEWLQHTPGRTSELSVQQSCVLGTAKILHRTSGHW